MNMPIDEAARIQEALKPLNYKVTGFRNGDCNKYGGIVIYLRHHIPVFRENPDVAVLIDEPGSIDEPTHGFQGTE
jgi:hypothetical protein